MFWLPLLSLLAMRCTGSNSQPVLTQPATASVSPGNTVKFSCVLSSGYSIGSYYIAWYQQKPGNPPRYLLYYYSDSSKGQGSGVPARFSGSKDASANTGYLTITGTLADDEADYYCGTYYSSGGTYLWIFGGGTRLQVTGQPTSPPTVNLFSPPAKDMQNEQKAMLVCLMDNFNPGEVTVTWEADGATISTGVETTVPVKHNTNYMASSYLTLDTSKWQSHERFTCKVTHKGTEYPKTINRSECP